MAGEGMEAQAYMEETDRERLPRKKLTKKEIDGERQLILKKGAPGDQV